MAGDADLALLLLWLLVCCDAREYNNIRGSSFYRWVLLQAAQAGALRCQSRGPGRGDYEFGIWEVLGFAILVNPGDPNSLTVDRGLTQNRLRQCRGAASACQLVEWMSELDLLEPAFSGLSAPGSTQGH